MLPLAFLMVSLGWFDLLPRPVRASWVPRVLLEVGPEPWRQIRRPR